MRIKPLPPRPMQLPPSWSPSFCYHHRCPCLVLHLVARGTCEQLSQITALLRSEPSRAPTSLRAKAQILPLGPQGSAPSACPFPALTFSHLPLTHYTSATPACLLFPRHANIVYLRAFALAVPLPSANRLPSPAPTHTHSMAPSFTSFRFLLKHHFNMQHLPPCSSLFALFLAVVHIIT